MNLSKIVRQLRNEREQTRAKLSQLDTALKVLGTVGDARPTSVGRRASPRTRRPMSAAAKKRIAAAQRTRWAKWRAARKNK
jgi:hypothetical protein